MCCFHRKVDSTLGRKAHCNTDECNIYKVLSMKINMKDCQSIQIMYREETSKPVIFVKSIKNLEITVHIFFDLETESRSINSVAPISIGQLI